jgi:hypothetical protein
LLQSMLSHCRSVISGLEVSATMARFTTMRLLWIHGDRCEGVTHG